jgi:RHS repeat-associated protein
MKPIQSCFTAISILLNLFFQHSSFAQIMLGQGESAAAPSEVKAGSITAGGFQGDVSLFTGTYQSEIQLGSVNSPSGLAFNVSLSNSSSFTAGDNAPFISGIPYGENWNLNLPQIRVLSEDYNKYTTVQLGNVPTPTFNANELALEGAHFMHSIEVEIPGVVSSRMIYKYKNGNQAIFVPATFERYFEASTTNGSTWTVVLDDGTIYEFNMAGINHSSPSYQRSSLTHTSKIDPITGQNLEMPNPNIVLPKSTYVTWYCTEISHRNKTGKIFFTYSGLGCFDFFPEVTSNNGLIEQNLPISVFSPYNGAQPLKNVCKDIIVKTIESESERLVFDYESIATTGGTTNMIGLQTPDITRLDSMYTRKKLLYLTPLGNSFYRYLHPMSNEANGRAFNYDCPNPGAGNGINRYTFADNLDPYKFARSAAPSQKGYARKITDTNNFRHSYFESSAIQITADMPAGDYYSVQALIQEGGSVPSLFDLNIVSGDQSGAACLVGTQSGGIEEIDPDYYYKTRGTKIYSTFESPFKWNKNAANINSLFVMPTMPTSHTKFYIQIGPSGADMNYSKEPGTMVTSNNNYSFISPLSAYYTFMNPATGIRNGDKMPYKNFGLGYPWWMMRNFYYKLGDSPSWFKLCPNQNPTFNFANNPTLAGETASLQSVTMYRVTKNPYMLKYVTKQVYNPGTTVAEFEAYGEWRNVSKQLMQYQIKTANRFATGMSVSNEYQKTVELKDQRNVVTLKSVSELPVWVDKTGFNLSLAPTTHFNYQFSEFTMKVTSSNAVGLKFNGLVLSEIQSPTGKKTTIAYHPVSDVLNGANTTGSHMQYNTYNIPQVFSSSTYACANATGTCCQNYINSNKPGENFSVTVNFVVSGISVEDRAGNSSQQQTSYTYSDFIVYSDRAPLNANLYRIEDQSSFKARTGFLTTTVTYALRDGKRRQTKYYHKGSGTNGDLPEGLTWGKLYKMEEYEATIAGTTPTINELRKRTTIDYEALLAFEAIHHRIIAASGLKFDYNEYFTYNHSSNYGTWTNAFLHGEDVPSPMTSTFNPSAYLAGVHSLICNSEHYNDIIPGDQLHISGGNGSTGIYSSPFYYGAYGSKEVFTNTNEVNRFHYNNSYFIRKVKETTDVFDREVSIANNSMSQIGVSRLPITTIKEFTYFDADFAGRSKCPGYGLMGLTLQSDSYYHLFWEPSFQLHSVHTYSPSIHIDKTQAFAREEYFYHYDLSNVPAYQVSPSTGNYNMKYTGTNWALMQSVAASMQIRNLVYERRKIDKVIGNDPARIQAEFYTYEGEWEEYREDEIWYAINSNAWPCATPNTPVSPTVPGISGTIGQYGNGCLFSNTGAPPGYCLVPGAPISNYYCECGLIVASPDSPNSSLRNSAYSSAPPSVYLDPDVNARAPFSIKGMYLLKNISTQVSQNTSSYQPISKPNPITGLFEKPAGIQTVISKTITRRNLFGQISQEVDAFGKIITYSYAPTVGVEKRICVNGQEKIDYFILNNHLGLPETIKIEAYTGDTYPLITKYLYNPDNSVKQVTDPNNMVLTYSYDYYGRVTKTYRNGKLLKELAYNQWGNNFLKTFKERATENYITETTHYGPGTLNGILSTVVSNFDRQYIDPIGRKVATIREGNKLLEDIVYDSWNNPKQSLKPRSGTAPSIDLPTGLLVNDITETQYDFLPDVRTIKSVKYGHAIGTGKSMQTAYGVINRASLLVLMNAAGVNLISPVGERFLVNRIEDEDNKVTFTFLNALGQTVATLANNANATSAVGTVVTYDVFGNAYQVVNPKNQLTSYNYNYLNKLYNEVTIDEGVNSYAYNRFGELIAQRDGKNITRVFAYDQHGRLLRQVKATEANSSSNITTIFANNGIYFAPSGGDYNNGLNGATSGAYYNIMTSGLYLTEKQTFYNNVDPWAWSFSPVNVQNFLSTSLSNVIGRPAMTMAYNILGQPVEAKYYSYNDDGFMKWELSQFNYNGITSGARGICLRIDYPSYNYQGSPKQVRVDLDSDNTLDFQYDFEYDNWNRLAYLYAGFTNAGIAGYKMASFDYDNYAGKVKVKKYFDHHPTLANCKNNLIETTTYMYDQQFRVTDILSGLFDWSLKYDGNNFSGYTTNATTNFNGNINASSGNYKFSSIIPSIATFAGQESATIYNYKYDQLNRLILADAKTGVSITLGDEVFNYDKIGNFTTTQRVSKDYTATPTNIISTYTYLTSTNRLQTVTPSGYTARQFSYDANGNLLTDNTKGVTNAQYGRGNTVSQFSLFKNSKSSTLRHEYNQTDSRIYKSLAFSVGVNVSEYYIKSSAGLDLGIYDFVKDTFVWYLYGAGSERIAKVNHLPPTSFGNLTTGGGGSTNPPAARAMAAFPSADFFDEEYIKELLPDNLIIKALQRLKTDEGKVLIPNTLYSILDEQGNILDILLATDTDIKLDQFKFIDTVELITIFTPLALPLDKMISDPESRDTIKPVLIITPEEVLGLRKVTEVQVSYEDQFEVAMEAAIMLAAAEPPATIVPQPIFYLNDHLGNTRVTFRADVCDGVPVKYYIDHAIDYYPYGKTLREYYPLQKERYLTTQHERDAETTYDNRGARLYDADVMRFLSVDPLAADYAGWSGYHYVLGNPLVFVDPDGRSSNNIVIPDLTSENMQTHNDGEKVFKKLSTLTRDELVYDNKTGLVTIKNKVEGNSKSEGTDLIRSLIEGGKNGNGDVVNYTVTINTESNNQCIPKNSENVSNGTGTSSTVRFNVDGTGASILNVDGTYGYKKSQNQIGLGHELIHARDNFYGNRPTDDSAFKNPDRGESNGIIISNAEFQTRGKENYLRQEQGFSGGKLRKRLVEL